MIEKKLFIKDDSNIKNKIIIKFIVDLIINLYTFPTPLFDSSRLAPNLYSLAVVSKINNLNEPFIF